MSHTADFFDRQTAEDYFFPNEIGGKDEALYCLTKKGDDFIEGKQIRGYFSEGKGNFGNGILGSASYGPIPFSEVIDLAIEYRVGESDAINIVKSLEKRGLLKDIRNYGRKEAREGYINGDVTIFTL